MISYLNYFRRWYTHRLLKRLVVLDAELLVQKATEARWRQEIEKELRERGELK